MLPLRQAQAQLKVRQHKPEDQYLLYKVDERTSQIELNFKKNTIVRMKSDCSSYSDVLLKS